MSWSWRSWSCWYVFVVVPRISTAAAREAIVALPWREVASPQWSASSRVTLPPRVFLGSSAAASPPPAILISMRLVRASRLSSVASNTSPCSLTAPPSMPLTATAMSGVSASGARSASLVGTNRPDVRFDALKYAAATRCTSAAVILATRSRYANSERQSPRAANSDSSIAICWLSANDSSRSLIVAARQRSISRSSIFAAPSFSSSAIIVCSTLATLLPSRTSATTIAR